MRDYEELVEALREDAEWAEGNIWEVPIMLPDNLKQAADAIEELTRENRSLADTVNKADEILRNRSGKWISVEERLPDGGVHVLACCRAKWLAGSGNLYVCDAFHSNPKTIVCSYDDDIDSEYDEETDEYYFPEGWWEVIKNWGDYSCVAIEDVVTHWMPLPEPPKEEKE